MRRMKIETTSEEVFACWAKSCAPPPAGKGGSAKGGPWSNRQRVAREKGGDKGASRAALKGGDEAAKKRAYYNMDPDERRRQDHLEIVRAGKAAVKRWDKKVGSGGAKGAKSGAAKAPGGKNEGRPGPEPDALDATKKYGTRRGGSGK